MLSFLDKRMSALSLACAFSAGCYLSEGPGVRATLLVMLVLWQNLAAVINAR